MRMLKNDEDKNVPQKREVNTLRKANRLVKEKSPYLLQHAYNPVDWFPWGEEAFEKARKEDKLIFLSIGYSTCYWCHVMEREVFENRSIADLMNLLVVSVKVDREERPDIDHVYMTALQAMTGNGGWPISIFITPDGKPIYAGTYIPPANQSGRPGFQEVLQRIHYAWINERTKILASSERLDQILATSLVPSTIQTEIKVEMLDQGYDEIVKSYDDTHGGFSSAPKFPRPAVLSFLLRYYHRTGNKNALDMVLTTLQKMALGGIHDQIGGGFHRYSTDERWHVPHFEKMLYDQAQLSIAYLEAFQITHEDNYAEIARDVLTYVQQELTHPDGGFYSAEDAESAVSPSSPHEKKEGAYYLWKKSEIVQILDAAEFKIAEFIFNIKQGGNVLSDPRQEFSDENVLHIYHSIEECARQFGLPVEEVNNRFRKIRIMLLKKRQQRPRPLIDDKILLSWNGLMISAFARAHQVLKDESFLSLAEQAARFIFLKLLDPASGQFCRRYRQNEVKYEAQLSDYAFFIQGLIDLYESSFHIEWLQKALTLNDTLIALFYDRDHGGFFDSSGADPQLPYRTKEVYDNSEPSGNSIAILNLLRLSHIAGNTHYREIAFKSLACFSDDLEKRPYALPQLLIALDSLVAESLQIVLAGNIQNPLLQQTLEALHRRFLPHKTLLCIDGPESQKILSKFAPFWGNLFIPEGKPTIYLCKNYTCELPIFDFATLKKALETLQAPEISLQNK